jgi:RES domain-containing protein
MKLWRISQQRHGLDKHCGGTAQFGGRWNPVGVHALYSSTFISLCALETFIHRGPAPLPPLNLVAIDLPDSAPIYVPSLADLPAGWNALPMSSAAQAFGGAWLAKATELAMRVPSVIIPEEENVVLNPRHLAYGQVRLSVARPFNFDARMFKHA